MVKEEKIIDIHSHVLPGIDDGSKNWDMTIEMLKMSWDAGVRAVIATPHYLPWRKDYSAKNIKPLCEEAVRRFKDAFGHSFPILPGQELFYHSGLTEDIEDGSAIALAESRYILVEFSEEAPFGQIREAAGKFQRSPYRMIIAHCERYAALREPKHLEEILEKGARLQSNAEEMQKGVFSKTKQWLKKRYSAKDIMYLGSDMHNSTDRPPLNASSLKWFDRHLAESDPYRRQLLWSNALEIVQNQC